MDKLPSHFFVSSTDGGLYDTRQAQWNAKPALRAVFNRTFRDIENTLQLRATLRAGAYAWPGGYPLYFITSDGAALSFETVKKHLRAVSWSIQNKAGDGWRVVACDINYEDKDLCDEHTGKPIESAYGE